MTLQDFINTWTGKPVDTDQIYPNQCMDLAHEYVKDVLGLGVSILSHPSAYQVYTDFTETQNFDKIANTPTGVPQPGDLVVFGQAVGQNGHICIFVSGDASNFKSFDANWPTGSLPHIQDHTYNGVLGWLHPKQQTTDELTECLRQHTILVDEANKKDEQIKQLQDTINSLNQTIDAKNKQIAQKDTDVSSLQSQLTAATQKIDSLSSLAKQVPVLEDENEQLEIDKKNLQADVTRLTQSNSQLKNTSYTTTATKTLILEIGKRVFTKVR